MPCKLQHMDMDMDMDMDMEGVRHAQVQASFKVRQL